MKRLNSLALVVNKLEISGIFIDVPIKRSFSGWILVGCKKGEFLPNFYAKNWNLIKKGYIDFYLFLFSPVVIKVAKFAKKNLMFRCLVYSPQLWH
jgi:hypothetical protein